MQLQYSFIAKVFTKYGDVLDKNQVLLNCHVQYECKMVNGTAADKKCEIIYMQDRDGIENTKCNNKKTLYAK